MDPKRATKTSIQFGYVNFSNNYLQCIFHRLNTEKTIDENEEGNYEHDPSARASKSSMRSKNSETKFK